MIELVPNWVILTARYLTPSVGRLVASSTATNSETGEIILAEFLYKISLQRGVQTTGENMNKFRPNRVYVNYAEEIIYYADNFCIISALAW